jgi:hypothetical protein
MKINGFLATLALVTVTVVPVGLYVAHREAAAELEPLRLEFIKTADRTDYRFDGTPESGSVLHYHGFLDDIVTRRDEWLAEHDCRAYGGWHVLLPSRDGGTMLDTKDIFYWCPLSLAI